MFILFDLDDTLIETSKCLTPLSLQRAFTRMQLIGLPASNTDFPLLKEINTRALTSSIALEDFWSRFSSDSRILQEGLRALKEPVDLPLDPVPGAVELLQELHSQHLIALVTLGSEKLQREKMKKAGIQPEQFCKIVVSQGTSKKSEYIQLLSEFQMSPEKTIVCGDRVPIDLTPAKELGCFCVHFRNGRGVVHDSPQESVDCTITQIHQLREIL